MTPTYVSHRRGPAQIAAPGGRKCRLCRQPPASSSPLCTDDLRDLGRMLDPGWEGDRDEPAPASIPAYWRRIDPTPGTTGPQDRRAPGFRSTPPLSLEVVVMRDMRSRPNPVAQEDGHARGVWFTLLPNGRDDVDHPHTEEIGQPRPIGVALANLATELWDHLGLLGPILPNGDVTRGDVEGLAGWLHARIDAIAEHPRVFELWGFLRALQDQLRDAAGDPAERPVGKCVGRIRIAGQHDQEVCGHPLYLPPPRPGVAIPPSEPVLRCQGCDRPYTYRELLGMEVRGGLGRARAS